MVYIKLDRSLMQVYKDSAIFSFFFVYLSNFLFSNLLIMAVFSGWLSIFCVFLRHPFKDLGNLLHFKKELFWFSLHFFLVVCNIA